MSVIGRGALFTAVVAGVALSNASAANAASAFGNIVSVDAEAKTISIKRRVKRKTTTVEYSVAEKVRIIINRKKATLADLKPNDRVTVTFSAKNGKNTATKIVATRRKRKKT